MANTYNPILSKEETGKFRLFQQRPIAEPGTALIFSGEGQPLITIQQGERGPTTGEMLWGKYNLLIKVDLTEHPLSFQFKLPCATDAFDFHAEVKFNCSVRDPAMIVLRNVTDVRQVLEPLIINAMRSRSRYYRVEESGVAEQDIGEIIKKSIYDAGFLLNQFALLLSLEDEARQRIRERKRIQDEIELEKVKQALERQKIDLEIEKVRQQDQLEIEREQERTQFELEQIRKRDKFEIEQEKTKLQEETEIQKMKQELENQKTLFEIEQARQRQNFEFESIKFKMEFYSPLLQAGNWQILAMQLAQNPQDVQLIINQINQQKQIEREHQMSMLRMIIKEVAFEGSQINEIGKRVLQGLISLTEQYTPSLESGSTRSSDEKKTVVETEADPIDSRKSIPIDPALSRDNDEDDED